MFQHILDSTINVSNNTFTVSIIKMSKSKDFGNTLGVIIRIF